MKFIAMSQRCSNIGIPSRSIMLGGLEHCHEYRLECGVRQGGITSPHLFYLYMNQLIVELSNTNIVCHIDGVCFNDISHVDDMVLLSPSISALRYLVQICEKYAVALGLRCNAKNSVLLVFYSHVPQVTIDGTPLNRVKPLKFLGHCVTEDLGDGSNIEGKRRAFVVRCNILILRFARCSKEAKITLLRAYSQFFYTCSL